MKIDAWSHILPKPYHDRLDMMTSGPGVCLLRTLAANRCLSDLEVRLRVMDRFPDYVQILTPVPSEMLAVALGNPALAHKLVPLANDAMAELVVKFPDRFAGFAAMLPMRDPDQALIELDRAITELGALGVQIETNINGMLLDDPR